uniref:GB1/RHD3-type G domain-containing protein n=1 Tax=Anser cygnoides TaxID=8845 RepID=A0A8B9DNT4_ANSCY
ARFRCHMRGLLCLVQNGADRVLSPNPAALEVLRGIGQPVVVVAIAGPYRTGKSFLMNRPAQRLTDYALGSIVHALTKGIWMWSGWVRGCVGRNDAWIFTLALLLSSTLVYNSLGTIDQQALQHLGYRGVGAGTAVSAPGSAGEPGGEVRGGHRQQRGAVPGERGDGAEPTSCAAGAGGAAEGRLQGRG